MDLLAFRQVQFRYLDSLGISVVKPRILDVSVRSTLAALFTENPREPVFM